MPPHTPRAGQGGDLGSGVAKLPRERLGGTCSRGAGGKGGGGWIWCGGWGVAAPAQAAANARCVHPQVAARSAPGAVLAAPRSRASGPPQATGSNKDMGEEVPSRAPGTVSGSACSQGTWHSTWLSVRSFWERGGRGETGDAQSRSQVPPELSLFGSITFKVLPGFCSTQPPLLPGGSSCPR